MMPSNHQSDIFLFRMLRSTEVTTLSSNEPFTLVMVGFEVC